MKKVTFKRVLAYILDIIFVFCIVLLFSKITFINPYIDEYEKTYTEYTELYSDYLEAYKNNASMLDDVENQLTELSYKINMYTRPTNIINIVVSIIYFVVFLYFNKGQTIAMRLFNIKLVSDDKQKLNIGNVLLRSGVIYSIFTSTILVLLLSFLSKGAYIKYSTYVSTLDGVIICVSLMFMMFRKDGKGLQDMLSGMNVVSSKENSESIKEATLEEKSKEGK